MAENEKHFSDPVRVVVGTVGRHCALLDEEFNYIPRIEKFVITAEGGLGETIVEWTQDQEDGSSKTFVSTVIQ